MQNLNQIRFVTTNYSNLQGLRAVPLGLCLVGVCLWANALQYPVQSYLVPVLILIGSAVLLLAIDRYYMRTFGRVKRTQESRRLEWLISIAGGILALAAFWADVSNKLPVSLLGLVAAAGLLADYVRITWLVKGRQLRYYLVGAILLAILSLLPLFGARNWWLAIGLRDQIVAIAIAIGIFSIFAGICGHIFLVHTLPPRSEELS